MSWRTVVVQTHSKLSYKDGYMIVKGENMNMVHLSEIGTLVVNSTSASITSALICELVKNKVNLIMCDEKHNPLAELNAYYGAYNTSKKVRQQVEWDEDYKKYVWTLLIQQKIMNQANVLHKAGFIEAEKLYDYAQNVIFFDQTNREGHAAKVYFNRLFGKNFSREYECDINAALDYGYAILLSVFNREIVLNGYITQLGIKHINEYNQFNLSCDIMEPFRVIVDWYVYNNRERMFNQEYKYDLINLLNLKVEMNDKELYLSNAIKLYTSRVFKAIEKKSAKELVLFRYP